jgi:hypothetical protein
VRGITRRQVLPHPSLGKSLRDPINRRLGESQNQCGCFADDIYALPLYEIQARFLRRPGRRLVATSTAPHLGSYDVSWEFMAHTSRRRLLSPSITARRDAVQSTLLYLTLHPITGQCLKFCPHHPVEYIAVQGQTYNKLGRRDVFRCARASVGSIK